MYPGIVARISMTDARLFNFMTFCCLLTQLCHPSSYVQDFLRQNQWQGHRPSYYLPHSDKDLGQNQYIHYSLLSLSNIVE